MIESAIADVISPAVTAEDPDGFLGEEVSVLYDFLGESACLAVAVLKAVLFACSKELSSGFL